MNNYQMSYQPINCFTASFLKVNWFSFGKIKVGPKFILNITMLAERKKSLSQNEGL